MTISFPDWWNTAYMFYLSTDVIAAFAALATAKAGNVSHVKPTD